MSEEDDDKYLWDGSGEADPEVVRLEKVLRPYRQSQPLGGLDAIAQPRREGRRVWRIAIPLAAAASIVLALVVAMQWRLRWPTGAPWTVVAVGGHPRVDGQPLTGEGRFAVGQFLETDGGSRATLRVARIGVVEVQPNSRLRLLQTRDEAHRMTLEHGAIAARLWAPPHVFAVDTAAGRAFDLGCAFTLAMDPGGDGLLRVSSGWVEFEGFEGETLVPAGAAVHVRRDLGPGSPWYEDATPAFRAALDALDFDPSMPRPPALETVLRDARSRDVITLFHLMRRARPEERPLLIDRAAQLLPFPPGVTREGVLAGDETMMNRWWNSLGLGSVKRWWVHWRDAFVAGTAR